MNTILAQIATVLSASQLASVFSLPTDEGEGGGERHRKCHYMVCDLMHRMAGMYQHVHHMLLKNRFDYVKKLQ